MGTVIDGTARDCRRHARHPIRLSAELLHAKVESADCVINNFSRSGMGVSIPATDVAAPLRIAGLRGDDPVVVTFTLPGEARRVRARTLLKNMRREGETIRMGLFFQQSHPIIMESLLKESFRRGRGIDFDRVTRGRESPVGAAREASGDATPEALDQDAHLDHLVPDICKLFFAHAKARLMERFWSDAESPEEFFRGLVAIQGRHEWLEERLLRCSTPTAAGIQIWFAKIVARLELSRPVQEELCRIFEQTLHELNVRR